MSSSATCCSTGLCATYSTVTSALAFGSPRTSGGVMAMIVPSRLLWNCFGVVDFMPSRKSRTAGSTSYWTSICRSASSAMCSLVAAMAAIGAPTSKTSSLKRKRVGCAPPSVTSAYSAGRLPRCRTLTTPAIFSALLISTLLIFAWGYRLRSVRMNSMPGMLMFSVYRPVSVTMPMPCIRAISVPMTLNVSAADGDGLGEPSALPLHDPPGSLCPWTARTGATISDCSATSSFHSGSSASLYQSASVSAAA